MQTESGLLRELAAEMLWTKEEVYNIYIKDRKIAGVDVNARLDGSISTWEFIKKHKEILTSEKFKKSELIKNEPTFKEQRQKCLFSFIHDDSKETAVNKQGEMNWRLEMIKHEIERKTSRAYHLFEVSTRMTGLFRQKSKEYKLCTYRAYLYEAMDTLADCWELAAQQLATEEALNYWTDQVASKEPKQIETKERS